MAFARPQMRASAGPPFPYRARRADPPLPFTRAFFDGVCAMYKQRIQRGIPYPIGEILLGLEAPLEPRPCLPGVPAHETTPCTFARPAPEGPLYSGPFPTEITARREAGSFDWLPLSPGGAAPCGWRPLRRVREEHDLTLLVLYHESRHAALREASAAELQDRGWAIEGTTGVWVLPQGPLGFTASEPLCPRRPSDFLRPSCRGAASAPQSGAEDVEGVPCLHGNVSSDVSDRPMPLGSSRPSPNLGGAEGSPFRDSQKIHFWLARRQPWDYPVIVTTSTEASNGLETPADAPTDGNSPRAERDSSPQHPVLDDREPAKDSKQLPHRGDLAEGAIQPSPDSSSLSSGTQSLAASESAAAISRLRSPPLVVELSGNLERVGWLCRALEAAQPRLTPAGSGQAGADGSGTRSTVSSSSDGSAAAGAGMQNRPPRLVLRFRSAIYYNPLTRKIHVYTSKGPVRLQIHAFASFCLEGGNVTL